MMKAIRLSSPLASSLLGLFLLAGTSGCSHSSTVEDVEATEDSLTVDPRGNPETIWSPEHPLIVDAPAKLLRAGGGRLIQEALDAKGIPIPADLEEWGDSTVDALRRFQVRNALAATGFPDARTLGLLGLDPEEIYRPAGEYSEIEARRRARIAASGKADRSEGERDK